MFVWTQMASRVPCREHGALQRADVSTDGADSIWILAYTGNAGRFGRFKRCPFFSADSHPTPSRRAASNESPCPYSSQAID